MLSGVFCLLNGRQICEDGFLLIVTFAPKVLDGYRQGILVDRQHALRACPWRTLISNQDQIRPLCILWWHSQKSDSAIARPVASDFSSAFKQV